MTRSAASEHPTAFLTRRLRGALWVMLATVAFFAVAHLDTDAEAFAAFYGVKAFQAVLTLAALALLRWATTWRAVVTLALVTVTLWCAAMGLGDVLAGHIETTPWLAIVCTMYSATLLPWGMGPQAACVIVLGVEALWAFVLTGRPWGELADPIASLIATLGVSIYVAYELQRERGERRRAEAALAERAQLEALRAEVRLGSMPRSNLRVTLQRCTEAIVRHLDAALARVWTLGADGTVLELQASAGMYAHVDGGHARVPVGALEIGLIAAERHPYVTNAVAADPRMSDPGWARREGMVAFAGHPLLFEGRLLGVVAMFARHELGSTAVEAFRSVAEAIAGHVERARVEDVQGRLLDELEHASRLKSEFLSTVSHELRTPLNVVLGYAEMARDQTVPVAERASCLDKIEGASRDLLGLIEDTLEIGRLDSGRDEVRRETIELGALWRAIRTNCAALTPRPGVVLDWRQDVPASAVVVDPRKLTLIVRNLVSNAVKFTERGRVCVSVELDGGALRVTVSDTGIGIAEADRACIFEMFRQADGSNTRRYGGTGLGLYIVRRFVEQLGGAIELDSVLGEGSTFTIVLPGVVARATRVA
jgi:signal transduction histidine kinase